MNIELLNNALEVGENPGLDTFDPRFGDITTLVENGDYPGAAAQVEEILKEDTNFPTTKERLIRTQGWKLFDLSDSKRVYARDFLQELPEGTYGNIEEIIDRLDKVYG